MVFGQMCQKLIFLFGACSKNEAFVYAKICKVLLIGFIEISNPNRWRDIKIHANSGTLNKKHYRLPATLRDFIFYKARRAKKAQQKISDRQRDRIDRDYRKNNNLFADSEMFIAMDQDYKLFGEEAFKNS